jgi:8-oxo-dGTP pyrophosphatase MutT (NUDIX family)
MSSKPLIFSDAKFPVSIKGVLLAPRSEVLLLMNERDEWELPGGRIEIGESPCECLRREIAEELQLKVEVGALLDGCLFEVIPGKHVFIVIYACTLIGAFAPALSNEHKRIGLFNTSTLPTNLPSCYRAAIALHIGKISD